MNPSKALILLVGVPGLSLAQPCQDIKDGGERLACYDAQNATRPAAEAEVPIQPASPAAAAAVPAVTPEPKPEPEPEPEPARELSAAPAPSHDFGKRERVEAPTQTITASIMRVQEAGNVDYLYLDNGQVWRETGGDSGVRFKEGKTVTITEGVLDSYDLKMEGRNKKAKVKRVR
jgi:hypothetical protein